MNRPYFVGVSGASGSGKTFFIEQLKKHLKPSQACFIAQDNYYFPLEQQPRDERGQVNFDHPQAVNLDLLYEHLQQLIQGKSVQIRQYNYNNPRLPTPLLTYHPAPIIIVEGLFVFYKKEIRELFDLKIFIEAEEHIRLHRRILRDLSERGYPLELIFDQYKHYVVPMQRRYVDPFRYHCDIIIPNNNHVQKSVEVVLDHLRWVLQQR